MLLLSKRSVFVDYLTSQLREEASSDWETDLLPTPASWDASTKTILLFTSSCLCLTSPAGVDSAEYSHRQRLQQPVQVALLDLEGNVLFWKVATFLLLSPTSGQVWCCAETISLIFSSVLRLPTAAWRFSAGLPFFLLVLSYSLFYSPKVAESLLSQ